MSINLNLSLAPTGLNEGNVMGHVNPEGNGGLESIPDPNVHMRIEYLVELQDKHDELTYKFMEEKAELVHKYQKLYEPLLNERRGVVTGIIDVGGKFNGEGVPNFWLIAMKKNDLMAMEIRKEDEEALKYLKDITYRKLDDVPGFNLIFTFDHNPFFKNSILTKTYHMIDDDEPILINAIGTVIEWFPGQSLINNINPMKRLEDESIGKDMKYKSFFNFFDPPQFPEDDKDFNARVVEEVQELLDLDYDVGCTIRNEIIADAVSWYTGEATTKYEAEHSQYYDEDDDVDEDVD